jgi:hypothetical protein
LTDGLADALGFRMQFAGGADVNGGAFE